MSEKINVDFKSLKLILDKNKAFVLPIVIILISVILFLNFVIPQFGALLVAREDAMATSLKTKMLKANLDILVNINEEVLNSQLETLNSALPLNKDFFGILNSIYSVSQKTGVGVGAFSLRIGDISKNESGGNFYIINVSIPVTSGVEAINSFAKAMGKAVPLAEVHMINMGEKSSTVGINFYYWPMNISGYREDVPIFPVSQKALTLVSQFKGFDNASPIDFEMPVATSSAGQ